MYRLSRILKKYLLGIFLTTLFIGISSAQTFPDEFDFDRIARATVFVMQTNSVDDGTIRCVGSGTIVHRSGLIVTNAHNTVTNPTCPGNTIIISLVNDAESTPIAQYYAEVVQANVGVDIAILRITTDLDGRIIPLDALALPFVEIADSSSVMLDETTLVVGYPSLSGDSPTVRRGSIGGFIDEPTVNRSWIKFEGRPDELGINGVMTGGGAYNQQGQLIGVPTTVPIVASFGEVNCTRIQDTNDDNRISNSDICIPLGGGISTLRPSNFVRPLLRSTSLGLEVEKISANQLPSTSQGEPAFRQLFFSTAVNENMPTRVVSSLPANPTSLYLFFDYANMSPEDVYELRVTTDEIINSTFSLPPVRWSGGTDGLWYIGNSGQAWASGTYEFTLFINGVVAGSTRIIIGVVPEETPSFRNVFFSVSEEGGAFGNVFVLPTGNSITARFIYQNMRPGVIWTEVWYLNGVAIRDEFPQNEWLERDGESGTFPLTLRADGGFLPGRYRLELYIQDEDGVFRLSALGDFTVAGARDGAVARVFSNMRTMTATTPQEAVDSVSLDSFPNTIRELYAVFDWEQLAPNTLWTMRWYVDGDLFYEEVIPWSNFESGQNFITRLSSENSLPDGTYRIELLINTQSLASKSVQIGIGQLPIDRFAQVEGIQLQGQIIDAETREGLPNVTVVIITEDFSVGDFVWDAGQIYTLAITDRNGRFQLDRLLDFDVPYSVMIVAESYLAISADGVVVTPDMSNPLEILLPMTRG